MYGLPRHACYRFTATCMHNAYLLRVPLLMLSDPPQSATECDGRCAKLILDHLGGVEFISGIYFGIRGRLGGHWTTLSKQRPRGREHAVKCVAWLRQSGPMTTKAASDARPNRCQKWILRPPNGLGWMWWSGHVAENSSAEGPYPGVRCEARSARADLAARSRQYRCAAVVIARCAVVSVVAVVCPFFGGRLVAARRACRGVIARERARLGRSSPWRKMGGVLERGLGLLPCAEGVDISRCGVS